MIGSDVNLLVYSHREELEQHAAAKLWLASVLDGDSAFGLADLVLSRFVRIATHRRAFPTPTPPAGATGNRVADAYVAALAIESGSEWLTTDRGFARYSGLRWRNPLA